MKGRPICKAEPLPEGVLRVVFDTGNTIMVNMTPRMRGGRFIPLREREVWNTVDTDGMFVHWYRDGMEVAEIAYDEILKMTLGESY